MRSVLVALSLVIASPSALAQGTPIKSDQEQKLTPPENDVPQDDPGACKLNVDKAVLQIFPPNKFKAAAGKSCSTICTLTGKDQVAEFGCDIAATLGADGEICSRKLSLENFQSLAVSKTELTCEDSAP